MLTPKHNGFIDEDDETDEEKSKHTASIKGMWKKAFKSLKSNDKQPRMSKKGSVIKRRDSDTEEKPPELYKDIDPVYSLLKCAADLPKVPKIQKEGTCSSFLSSKGDCSDSTSKTSSPSSSEHHHHHHHHPTFSTQLSLESAISARRESRASSPAIAQRELMHHLVDESLGSEFRTFYKLTSPVKKNFPEGAFKKQARNSVYF
ncbi:unnamed protein product [Candidula unifasciata]|uniref:Uncharacterized protein n=1 Tax=Candidula unifasciata TaxID=100452 RepID=A0A8S3ZNI2_9EUPU|nr:unnamed protein product [Candidula unifasciata]